MPLVPLVYPQWLLFLFSVELQFSSFLPYIYGFGNGSTRMVVGEFHMIFIGAGLGYQP